MKYLPSAWKKARRVTMWENEYYRRVFCWLVFGIFIGFVIGYTWH